MNLVWAFTYQFNVNQDPSWVYHIDTVHEQFERPSAKSVLIARCGATAIWGTGASDPLRASAIITVEDQRILTARMRSSWGAWTWCVDCLVGLIP